MMKEFLREDLRDFQPYQANDVEYLIKLDANESPFDLPDCVKKQLAFELMGKSDFNRYPDPGGRELRGAIAEACGVDREEVVLGNGSDELIQILVHAFINKGEVALCPVPSFVMYKICTQIGGGIAVEIPLDENFEYQMDAYYKAIEEYNPKMIFLCSPNNPTGNTLSEQEIIKLAEGYRGVIVVDEAYCEFSGGSLSKRIVRYPNIIVLRTFSKAMGLAGLRIGYLICNKDLALQINKVKPPYNLNRFSQRAAVLMLKNQDIIKERIRYIIKQREELYRQLNGMAKVRTFPSQANFLLIQVPDADRIAKRLLDEGILVRGFQRDSRLKDCLRITVGLEEENRSFVRELRRILKEERQ